MEKSREFAEKCYELLRQVPRGKVTTYKHIAEALGCKAYRAVGRAMSSNPYAPEVPCHRVVNADGRLGGYALGLPKKIDILSNEGIRISNNRVVDLEKSLYTFCK